MNQPADGYAAQLGTHADWGLTRESFTPLRDELADHLHCLSDNSGPAGDDLNPRVGGTGVSGAGAPARDSLTVASKLTTPKARRALTSTRIADQVYATLHRWPTRHEWREFAWLLFWFALILVSDWIAHGYNTYVADLPDPLLSDWSLGKHIADRYDTAVSDLPARLLGLLPGLKLQAFCAWGLQAIARAGFFTLFVYTLWHAWRVGKGVLLARILQLKLIHTVLVIGAFYVVGRSLFSYTWQYSGWVSTSSTFFTGPLIALLLLIAGFGIWIVRRKHWPLALCSVLIGIFAYSGGPVNYEVLEIQRPILTKRQLIRKELVIVDGKPVMENGNAKTFVPDEQTVLAKYREKLEREYAYWERISHEYDFERNLHTYRTTRMPLIFGSYFSKGGYEDWKLRQKYEHEIYPKDWTERIVETRSTTPMSVGGAGLGWLAAPIPFLGIVGLVGLLFMMGRRSPVSFTLYAVLTVVSIVSTVLPFFFVQQANRVILLSAEGMVAGPFPGFDSLFVGGSVSEDWMLVLGLFLSAVIPWLLTALFLKPTNTPQPTSGPELAA